VPAERLQKIIAAAGIASRRKAEQLITAGLVTVNGQTITELGSKADPAVDHIRVSGKPLREAESKLYLMLNKPRGYVSTVHDPEGRATVMDLVRAVGARVFPIGRLDYNSEGLLLLTNDGDLAQRLTHASFHVPKTYLVKVSGQPTDEALDRLRGGVTIHEQEDGRTRQVRTAPARIDLIRDAANPWYEITLYEGRNRQLHRMFEKVGHHVEKIRRVRYGPLQLDVEPGKFRALTPSELKRLQAPSPQPQESRTAPEAAPQERVGPAALGHTSGTQRRSDAKSGHAARHGQRPKPDHRRPKFGKPQLGKSTRDDRRPAAMSESPREQRRSFGGRPERSDRRPQFGKPRRDDRRPAAAGDSPREQRPPFAARPERGDRRPNFGKPRRDDRRPAAAGDSPREQRPPFGARPERGDRRPQFGKPRRDDRRPVAMSDSPRGQRRPFGARPKSGDRRPFSADRSQGKAQRRFSSEPRGDHRPRSDRPASAGDGHGRPSRPHAGGHGPARGKPKANFSPTPKHRR
jgi:23S rRNA pseudouridine2605 synthase